MNTPLNSLCALIYRENQTEKFILGFLFMLCLGAFLGCSFFNPIAIAHPPDSGATLHVNLSEDSYQELLNFDRRSIKVAARIGIDGYNGPAFINVHGNSSRNGVWKNYRLTFPEDEKYRGNSEWVLSAQHFDPSYSKTQVVDKLLREQGLHTPRIFPIFMQFNNDAYRYYLMIERINTDYFDHRNIAYREIWKMEPFARFRNEPDLLSRFTSVHKKNADPYKLYQLVDQIEERLKNNPEAGIDWVSDSIGKFMYISEATANIDGLQKNTYFYLNDVNKWDLVPWDLDLTLSKGKEDLLDYDLYEWTKAYLAKGENRNAYLSNWDPSEILSTATTEISTLLDPETIASFGLRSSDKIKESRESVLNFIRTLPTNSMN